MARSWVFRSDLVASPSTRRAARLVLVVLLAAASILAAVRTAVYLRTDPTVGRDIHGYWYYGHFLRQRQDPYRAFFDDQHPQLPVAYVDGYVEHDALQKPPALTRIAPSNTAPMFLLLSVLSFVSWPTTVALWTALLIGLALALPWLALWLLPFDLDGLTRLCIALLFYGMVPTRVAITSGQTTLPVFCLMIAAVLLMQRQRTILAGLALGLALSKYSLAAPALLLILWRRQFGVVLAAAATQLAGVVFIALLGGTDPLSVIRAQFDMFAYHVTLEQTGVDLASALSDNTMLKAVTLGLLTAALVAALSIIIWRDRAGRLRTRIGDFWLLSALSMWTLMVAYHRSYDVVLAFLPLVLIAGELSMAETQPHAAVTAGSSPWLAVLLGVAALGLLLPGSTLDEAVRGWGLIWSLITTFTPLLLLGGVLYLGERVRSGKAALAHLESPQQSPALAHVSA